MTTATSTALLRDLSRHARALFDTTSPAETFRLVLEAARAAAPRAAIFLVHHGRIKGWSSIGYATAAALSQREFVANEDEGWLGEVSASELGSARRDGPGPDFGQPAADETAVVALRIRSKTVGLLVGERSAGESPWHPEALDLLAALARLRLDLDMAHKKLRSSVAASAPRPETPAGEPVEVTELAPVSAETEPAGGESDAARRYARLVATDVRLYNEHSVVLGRRHGDLVERLGEQLIRGKETFLRRHHGLGEDGIRLLHEAYVEVLAGGDEALLPFSVLD